MWKLVTNFAWRVFCGLLVSEALWSQLISFVWLIAGNRTRVKYDQPSGIYRVQSLSEEIWVARRSRIRLFHRGVLGRLNFVENSYSLPKNVVEKGNVVIDCGANIGEFSRAMELKGAVVLAFEPDPREFKALEKNLRNRGSKAYSVALWSKSGEVFLNQANDTGDSAVVKSPQEKGDDIAVFATTLDEWATSNLAGDTLVSVLKLEAEGAEFDVILGAAKTLRRVKYICADLGEPTLSSSNAVAEVTNLLMKSGFEIVSFSKNRCMTVFRNLQLNQISG